MQLFLQIVEAGSITAAAEKLELSKSVLSQHLKALESDLGLTLLKRTTRKQSLTSAGEAFLVHCREIDRASENAWAEVQKGLIKPKGKLTITAPHAYMDTIVIPAVSDCFRKYTDVELNFICSDHKLDLMSEGIDLALRVGDSKDSNYKQIKIAEVRDVLCCAINSGAKDEPAGYIANHWEPRDIEHQSVEGKIKYFKAKHRTDTVQQTLSLIAANMGLGVVPEHLVVQRNDVKPAFNGFTLKAANIYLLHPYQQHTPLTVQMASDAIKNKMK